MVNLFWGAANIAIGYGLVLQVGRFDLRELAHAATLGAGGLCIGLYLAWHFGSLYGGNKPEKGQTSPTQM